MWLKKRIDDEKWGEMNLEVARLTREKRLDEALELAQQLLKCARKSFGKRDKRTAVVLNNLGIINLLKEDFDEAEAYLLLALQVTEKVSGKHDRNVSAIDRNLARLHSARARHCETQGAFEERAYPRTGFQG
ncbi:MAG TPA: tetratricopeptide repeat protein [Chloroflexota bacterium]|nr:tetratricopeptide repeat protein [Chloroflexota bacterium]